MVAPSMTWRQGAFLVCGVAFIGILMLTSSNKQQSTSKTPSTVKDTPQEPTRVESPPRLEDSRSEVAPVVPFVEAPYVLNYREDRCLTGDDGKVENDDAWWEADASSKRREEPMPSCPEKFEYEYVDNNKTDGIAQQSGYVTKKYKMYASGCGKKDGVMWALMTKGMHDRFCGRVMDLLLMGNDGVKPRWSVPPGMDKPVKLVPHPITSATIDHGKLAKFQAPRRKLRWLDWASGCGADLEFYYTQHLQFINRAEAAGVTLESIGIDVTEAAVLWGHERARKLRNAKGVDASIWEGDNTMGNALVRTCLADGTKLSWLPKNTFDVITSTAGLYHVPSVLRCKTMQMVVDLLRPGGKLLTCFVPPRKVADSMFNCMYKGCQQQGVKIKVSRLDLKGFLADINMHPAYFSIVKGEPDQCIMIEKLRPVEDLGEQP